MYFMVGPGLAQNGILSPDVIGTQNLKGLLAKTKDGVGDSRLRPFIRRRRTQGDMASWPGYYQAGQMW